MHYATRFNGIPVSVTLAAAPALADRPIDAPDRYEHSCIETPLGPKSLLLKLQLRRVDGSPFKVTACKVEAAVPGLDLHRVFVPVLHEAIGKRDLISLPWGVEERTFTSWSFPFGAALNRFDQNRFCMGFMDHVHAADTRHSCYDEDANMSLQRLFDPAPRETSVWEETLYLSCEDRPVFDEVRAFSRTYDEWHKVALPPAPPSVWEPIWCSWYGVKNDVDADYIRSMVPVLKEWGIGNIIVDAGWFKGDGFDPDTGHYIPDTSKFPDLKGLVAEVQSAGLTILLWCAPLFNISDLADVPFIKAHRFQAADSDEANNFLCPHCPAVRQYAWRTVKHLMQTYGCNGLKIDFIDPLRDRASLPCTADHEHDIADYGEAVYDLLQGSHRAQDAPFDPDHIRRMCTRLKS